jgi:hypothetical protein
MAESKARSGFTDFLILKRALVRADSDTVPFSSTDPHFTGAIRELAATVPTDAGIAEPPVLPGPFIKVFGTAEYVSRKMVTNGSADTLSGPGWRQVIRIVGSRPRSGGLERGYESYLEPLLLKNNGRKPSLGDAAVWFHRATDLQTQFSAEANEPKKLLDALTNSFVKGLGLTKRDISELFDGAIALNRTRLHSSWSGPSIHLERGPSARNRCVGARS